MVEKMMIDLTEMTDGGKVSNLSGRPRGLAARIRYKLDWHNVEDVRDVKITVPSNVDSITPSFFQGMFGSAFIVLDRNRTKFFDHFDFDVSPLVLNQVEQGIAALEISRDLADLT